MTPAEHESIRAAVHEVDPRIEYATSERQKEPWGPVDFVGIVLLSVGKHRFGAPFRDGKITPFEVTDVETTKALAVSAARELREFWETNL
jgi:hypothetical protein